MGVLLAILCRYFAGLDLSLVGLRLRESGFALLLVLLPYGCALLAESIAWRLAIRPTPGPGMGWLYLIRMATDAVLYSIPGGVALAEPMRPVLLRRQCGIDLTEGIGSCIITKIIIAVAQVVFVLVGCILMMVFYPGVGLQPGVGEGPAGYLAVGSALLCSVGLLTFPLIGPRLTGIARLLSCIPVARWRELLARGEPALRLLDAHVGRFARDHSGRFVGSLLSGFASWLLLAFETYVILRFLGADPTFTQAVALEAVASLLRIMFFFIPSGLGASEIGFVTLLVAFGFPQAITLAAAYIAIKRLKEAGWVALGYMVFWFAGFNPFRRVSGPTPIVRTSPLRCPS
jgi:uncharacterized membrane protein YbhN (UPF0104 family)